MSGKDNFQSVVRRAQARLNSALALESAAAWTLSFALGAGAAILLVRLFLRPFEAHSYWLLLLIPAAALFATARALSKRFSPALAAAFLDSRAEGSGLLLSQWDAQDAAWTEQTQRVSLRARDHLPRFRSLPTLVRFLGAIVFAAIACAVPVPRAAALVPVGKNPLLEDRLALYEESIETLKEDEALPPEELEKFEKEVQSLKSAAENAPFSREALEGEDAFRQAAEDRLAGAAERAGRAAEAAESLQAALEEGLDESELLKRRDELERALAQAAQFTQAQAPKKGDSHDLKSLRERLRSLRRSMSKEDRQRLEEELRKAAERLAKQGRTCRKIAGRYRGKGQKFAYEGEQWYRKKKGAKPGQGGVDRGRGDAPMVFGDESPELKKKLKTEFVPSDVLGSLEDSELMGLSASSPEESSGGSGPSATGAREGQSEPVWQRRLSVSERRVLKTYFSDSDTD